MAKNTRQQFVQARLKATGKEATPEQRAKLRERFNTLSQTKEGRTKIAQAILPSGTASDRAALKKSLRPPPSSTTTSTTGVTGGVSNPPGSSASSAVVPGAKLTPPTVPTSTTVPRLTTSTTTTTVPRTTTTVPQTTTTVPRTTTTTTVPAAQKSNNSGPGIVNFEPKGTPRPLVKGPKSKYSPANLEGLPFTKGYKLGNPADFLPGYSNINKGVSQFTGGKKLQGAGNVIQGVSEVLMGVLSLTKGKSKQLALGPGTPVKPSRTFVQPERIERLALGPGTRPNFGTVAEQRAANPPPGNRDFKFPSIKQQQTAYVYKPPKTRAGQPGTSGKNFSVDEYGRPVKLPKNK